MRFITIYIFLATFCIIAALGQNEANVWVFGKFAGIDFNSGAPLSFEGSKINSLEGCASICGYDGKLLFYTDGIRVWDRSHVLMPGGSDLMGSTSSTQSAIIVPSPGVYGQYYIFTVGALEGDSISVHYSLADMALNSGFGDIDPAEKNIRLFDHSVEKITSARHSNGIDYWVILHKWQSDEFHAFKVTNSGVDPVPVISRAGSIHDGDIFNKQGYMKSSPDGKKIALAIFKDGIVEVFDFNNTTGEVSGGVTISGPRYKSAYGIEFSPEANFLYLSCLEYPSEIYQFNLNAGSASEILNSSYQLTPDSGSYFFGALQMGPDKKIYSAKKMGKALGMIAEPEKAGQACNFVDDAVPLGSGISQLGLPTYVTSFFQSISIGSNSPLCEGDTLLLTCNNVAGGKYEWHGPAGFTSDRQNPSIGNISSANSGIYTVIATELGGRKYTASTYVDIIKIKITLLEGESVDLGKVCLGKDIASALNIKNSSGYQVTLDSIYLKGNSPEFNFIDLQPLPLNIRKDSVMKLDLGFKPLSDSLYGDSLIVTTSFPCRERFTFHIRARGLNTSTLAWLPADTISYVGVKRFCIPLKAMLSCIDSISLDLGYRAVLRFDAGLFLVNEITGAKILRNEIHDWKQIIEIEGEAEHLDSAESTLAEICGEILLGDRDYSELSFESFAWSDSLIGYDTLNGRLFVTGVCRPSLTKIRQFRAPELNIYPTPVEGTCEFVINNLPEGNFRIDLVDITGKILLKMDSKNEKMGDEVRIKADLTALPDGVYFARLTNGSGIINKLLVIRK